jgi:hypothetical protein
MISNEELILIEDMQTQTKRIKFHWYDHDAAKNMFTVVVIPNEYIYNANSYYDPWNFVRLEFAKELNHKPAVLYAALLELDKSTGQASVEYNEISSIYYSDPTFLPPVYGLSLISREIYEKAVNKQPLPNNFTVTWKSESHKMNVKVINHKFKSYGNEVSVELSRASNYLPGVNEQIKFPCGKHTTCHDWNKTTNTVKATIMKLNDHCKWTREQIADWLETLDIDMIFKTNTKEIENV